MLRIGIDVGGTHTDAVLLDGDAVIASTKALTSADVTSGILEALETILTQHPGLEESVAAVMLGTTQFTNAVVQRRELAEVAAVRIGMPSGVGLPPKIGWPEDISRSLGEHVYMIRGGYLYDGWPIAELDDKEMNSVVADLKAKKVEAVAISSAFSPMNAEPEQILAKRIRAAIPGVRITESHHIGRLGILERENAAMLNASLLSFADRVVTSFVEAIRKRGLKCRFFVSQNDGTLMDAEFARRFPALTFASGPTNSIRGACKLTGLSDAIVVDIGGTTSDIGILQDGFPRESSIVIEVGGVRTNFRMPDILAIGLGGGSLVLEDGRRVGPQSVGHELVTKGLVFGGDTLTTTDIVVATGDVAIGDPARVAGLDAAVVANATGTISKMLNAAIEKMKPSSDPLPVVLVGGGAVLVTDKLDAASQVLRPEYAGVANAIGAAIAQIGGETERLVSYDKIPRQQAVKDVTADAKRIALAAGADASTIRVADIEETSISYMAGNTTRLRVKVVGEIGNIGGVGESGGSRDGGEAPHAGIIGACSMKLAIESLEDLSTGAVFLATGGGGDPYVSYLATKKVLEERGPAEMIAVDELDDHAFVVAIGAVGAPTVSLELLPSVDDAALTLEAFERHVGRKVDAVVSFEIGGGNSLIPIMAAASRGIPVVDGDGMGRALPEAQMMTYPIGGVLPTPAVGLDYAGNIVTFSTDSTSTYERHVRAMAQAMGGMIITAEHPMTGRQLKASVVPGTISFSIEIGRILREYRGNTQRVFAPLKAAFDQSLYGELCHIYTGKVIDHSSSIIGGYDIGEAVIESFNSIGPPLKLDIKNEFLVARLDDQVVASVPDLITILDHETSMPINAERLRYGQRVTVLGMGCPAYYRTARALEVVAPRCFGLDFEFVPIEDLKHHHQPQLPR